MNMELGPRVDQMPSASLMPGSTVIELDSDRPSATASTRVSGRSSSIQLIRPEDTAL